MADEVDRRGIGPVEIVKSHDQRALVRKPPEQGTEGTQEAVAFVRRGDGSLPCGARGERGKYGRKEFNLPVGERETFVPKRGERALQRVDEHRERHVSLEP